MRSTRLTRLAISRVNRISNPISMETLISLQSQLGMSSNFGSKLLKCVGLWWQGKPVEARSAACDARSQRARGWCCTLHALSAAADPEQRNQRPESPTNSLLILRRVLYDVLEGSQVPNIFSEFIRISALAALPAAPYYI
jgi:hypothetical protein